MDRNALISPCGLYRYWLTRRWAEGPMATWIMLNPSTADAEVDDATIRRCIAFSRSWGYGELSVVNLYAYRATKPADLIDAAGAGIDPVGPDNAQHVHLHARYTSLVVAAWGAHKIAEASPLVRELAGRPLHCLGVTKAGHPRHPLYVRAAAQPLLLRTARAR